MIIHFAPPIFHETCLNTVHEITAVNAMEEEPLYEIAKSEGKCRLEQGALLT